MNPIYNWIIAHTVNKKLARRCPKCRKEIIVSREKKLETITCPHCQSPIPPDTQP